MQQFLTSFALHVLVTGLSDNLHFKI